jgi:hypothetical protein
VTTLEAALERLAIAAPSPATRPPRDGPMLAATRRMARGVWAKLCAWAKRGASGPHAG